MIAGVEFGGDSKPLDGNKRERISMGFFVWVLPQDQGHNYRHMEEDGVGAAAQGEYSFILQSYKSSQMDSKT